MNKKIIKYLIWTIIIAAVLILMPIKETKAATTVNYSTFKTSKNYFCLNKGYPFGKSETFNNIYSIKDNKEFTFPGTSVKVPTDALKYIVAIASDATKTSIDSFTPQKAIWSLATEKPNYTAGRALAYANFVKYMKENNIDSKPYIKKIDSKHFAIYYYKVAYNTWYYHNYKGIYTITGGKANLESQGEHVKGNLYRDVFKVTEGNKLKITAKYEVINNAKLNCLTSPVTKQRYIL